MTPRRRPLPDDLLPPAPTVAVVATAPAAEHRPIVCENCGCKLTRKGGEVLEFSDKARQLRDLREKHERTVDELNRTIEDLKRALSEAKAERAAVEASPRRHGQLFS